MVSLPILGLFVDLINGKELSDYFINGFNLSFAIAYFLIIRFLVLNVTVVYIEKTIKFCFAVLSLFITCVALWFCAYHFYLSDPFRIVNVKKYVYHAWSLGLFLSLHSAILSFTLLFGFTKIVQGKYMVHKT